MNNVLWNMIDQEWIAEREKQRLQLDQHRKELWEVLTFFSMLRYSPSFKNDELAMEEALKDLQHEEYTRFNLKSLGAFNNEDKEVLMSPTVQFEELISSFLTQALTQSKSGSGTYTRLQLERIMNSAMKERSLDSTSSGEPSLIVFLLILTGFICRVPVTTTKERGWKTKTQYSVSLHAGTQGTTNLRAVFRRYFALMSLMLPAREPYVPRSSHDHIDLSDDPEDADNIAYHGNHWIDRFEPSSSGTEKSESHQLCGGHGNSISAVSKLGLIYDNGWLCDEEVNFLMAHCVFESQMKKPFISCLYYSQKMLLLNCRSALTKLGKHDFSKAVFIPTNFSTSVHRNIGSARSLNKGDHFALVIVLPVYSSETRIPKHSMVVLDPLGDTSSDEHREKYAHPDSMPATMLRFLTKAYALEFTNLYVVENISFRQSDGFNCGVATVWLAQQCYMALFSHESDEGQTFDGPYIERYLNSLNRKPDYHLYRHLYLDYLKLSIASYFQDVWNTIPSRSDISGQVKSFIKTHDVDSFTSASGSLGSSMSHNEAFVDDIEPTGMDLSSFIDKTCPNSEPLLRNTVLGAKDEDFSLSDARPRAESKDSLGQLSFASCLSGFNEIGYIDDMERNGGDLVVGDVGKVPNSVNSVRHVQGAKNEASHVEDDKERQTLETHRTDIDEVIRSLMLSLGFEGGVINTLVDAYHRRSNVSKLQVPFAKNDKRMVYKVYSDLSTQKQYEMLKKHNMLKKQHVDHSKLPKMSIAIFNEQTLVGTTAAYRAVKLAEGLINLQRNQSKIKKKSGDNILFSQYEVKCKGCDKTTFNIREKAGDETRGTAPEVVISWKSLRCTHEPTMSCTEVVKNPSIKTDPIVVEHMKMMLHNGVDPKVVALCTQLLGKAMKGDTFDLSQTRVTHDPGIVEHARKLKRAVTNTKLDAHEFINHATEVVSDSDGKAYLRYEVDDYGCLKAFTFIPENASRLVAEGMLQTSLFLCFKPKIVTLFRFLCQNIIYRTLH